ncbi:MAG: rRNA maturation RNase YbeY [bacterium]
MSSEKRYAEIQIRSLPNLSVNLEFLKKVASRALESKEVHKDKEVSIVLVDNKMIKQLNEKFRGRREVTDVLAFPLGGEFISTESFLGEIVISVEKAKEAAKEGGHRLEEELALLVVHGILHLLGYADEKEKEREVMRGKEGKILESLGIKVKIEKETTNEIASQG